MKKKKLLIPIIVVLLLIVIIIVTVILLSGNKYTDAQPTASLNAVLTYEQAEEDLAFMYDAVKKNHPCYLDGSELYKTFDIAYEKAKEKLRGYDIITVRDLWETGAEMYCSLEDGHTLITFYNSKQILESEKLSDGEIISVDGIERSELLSKFRYFFPCEPQVDFYADYMLDEALKLESWNTLLGVDTSDGITIVIGTETGIETLECTFGYSEAMPSDDSVTADEAFYSYEFYDDKSSAVFKLDKCELTDGYKSALESFFKEVNEKGITRVAVDLRENGGGNSMVINEFMKYIDIESYCVFGGNIVRTGEKLIENKAYVEKNKKSKYAFSGELYVLTSNYTFSSGMDFAVTISDNKIGKVIGEIPGNMPTSYGDKLFFQPPNSKLLCNVSYKKFYRVDRNKDDIPLIPDIESDEKDALDIFLNSD